MKKNLRSVLTALLLGILVTPPCALAQEHSTTPTLTTKSPVTAASNTTPSPKALQNLIAALEHRLAALEKKVTDLTTALADEKKLTKAARDQKILTAKSREELITDAVATNTSVVVSIIASRDVPRFEKVLVNPFGDDPNFKDSLIRIPVLRQKGTERQKVGAGTGFFISKSGYIATNKHVVADTSSDFTVFTSNGLQLPAKVMYRDPVADLALVKIEQQPNGLTVKLGDSSSLKLGQSVLAIGNALGQFDNSVSVGVISGLNRTIQASDSSGGNAEQLTGVIQTDTAINPGNSGGPLVNLDGEVVGINVATVVGSQNISFAIPINLVKKILDTLPIF